MTNAEKLAKDTEFMINALLAYCGSDSDCMFCKFGKENEYGCKIGLDNNDRNKRIDNAKAYLESENNKDGKV